MFAILALTADNPPDIFNSYLGLPLEGIMESIIRTESLITIESRITTESLIMTESLWLGKTLLSTTSILSICLLSSSESFTSTSFDISFFESILLSFNSFEIP